VVFLLCYLFVILAVFNERVGAEYILLVISDPKIYCRLCIAEFTVW